MPLNLKTLATRSISAAVFVVLLVGCVMWNFYSFSLFFFLVSLIGLNEFIKISEKLGAVALKYISFLFAIAIYISSVPAEITGFQKDLFLPVTAASFFVILSVPVFSSKHSIKDSVFGIAGILYSVLPFALLNRIVVNDGFFPMTLMGVIILIWSNDTFAYLGGSLFGKHKMIERISPGKTWEGTITGIIITFGLSFLLIPFIPEINPIALHILGIGVPVLATVGDLVESKLKREAGIKDSGSIMPGHGGVLDRFDSLIFISPFIYLLFELL